MGKHTKKINDARACLSFISSTAGGYFCVRQGGKHAV